MAGGDACGAHCEGPVVNWWVPTVFFSGKPIEMCNILSSEWKAVQIGADDFSSSPHNAKGVGAARLLLCGERLAFLFFCVVCVFVIVCAVGVPEPPKHIPLFVRQKKHFQIDSRIFIWNYICARTIESQNKPGLCLSYCACVGEPLNGV